jgi:hypothetical protein
MGWNGALRSSDKLFHTGYQIATEEITMNRSLDTVFALLAVSMMAINLCYATDHRRDGRQSARVVKANPADIGSIPDIIRVDYECVSGPPWPKEKVRQEQRDGTLYICPARDLWGFPKKMEAEDRDYYGEGILEKLQLEPWCL